MSEQTMSSGAGRHQVVGIQRLLTYREAAEILAVKPQTLRQWVSSNRIPYVKIGKAVRFHQTQLEDFISSSSR